ncbi:hypothetical protein K5X82_13605 [Halosquirtibacter xylanolyticus]|uniref:hypothetical protein n=1 Tax=Halosquirtibacter xylanolyticus TaxID=3374599 RepID=UPI00374A6704|nr:hypothetical protein K5X82_13605 [Prolixibacteraceae bacterium]
MTDVLGQYQPNTWSSAYANIQSTMDSDADSQLYRFSLRYRLGVNKKRRLKSSNEKSLRRI